MTVFTQQMVIIREECEKCGEDDSHSINGTELSSKGNRELALQIQSNDAYDLLAAMFLADWGHDVYLPVIFNNYLGPRNTSLSAKSSTIHLDKTTPNSSNSSTRPGRPSTSAIKP